MSLTLFPPKKFLFMLVVAAILLLIASGVVQANPLMDGKPSAAHSEFMAGFSSPFAQKIVAMQRQIHAALTDQITLLKQGESLTPLWWLLLISLAYGVFHVLAPGHGKVIVTSYFLGNKARWREGVMAGALMALGHTVTSVGIVVTLYLVMGFGQFQTLNNALYIEFFSYGLIIMIGFWMLYNALRKNPATCCNHHHDHGHAHNHEHHHHTPPKHQSTRFFAIASLVPCTGSMIILLFTLANDVLWAGILAVICIALGMWLTVTAIGVLSILLRHMIVGDDDTASPQRQKLITIMKTLAALLIIATGSVLCLGAAYSLAG